MGKKGGSVNAYQIKKQEGLCNEEGKGCTEFEAALGKDESEESERQVIMEVTITEGGSGAEAIVDVGGKTPSDAIENAYHRLCAGELLGNTGEYFDNAFNCYSYECEGEEWTI